MRLKSVDNGKLSIVNNSLILLFGVGRFLHCATTKEVVNSKVQFCINDEIVVNYTMSSLLVLCLITGEVFEIHLNLLLPVRLGLIIFENDQRNRVILLISVVVTSICEFSFHYFDVRIFLGSQHF